MEHQSTEVLIKKLTNEMRPPLESMSNFVELLKTSQLTTDQLGWLSGIQGSSESIKSLLYKITDLINHENENVTLDSIDFNLKQTVHQVISDLSFKIGDRDITLSSQIDANVKYRAKGDPRRLRDTLRILMKEAISLTKKGDIELSLIQEKEVEDDITIRIEVLVQEPKNNVDLNLLRSSHDLSFCKRIINQMEGLLGAEFNQDGSFHFWFTCHLKKQLSNKKIKEKFLSNIKGMNVLIADYNNIRRQYLKQHFKKWELNYEEAKEESDAFELIKKRKEQNSYFNFILVQHSNPGIDGFHFAQSIKPYINHPGISMIMLTPHGVRGDAASALSVGFHGYLASPITEPQLFDCMLHTTNLDKTSDEKVLVTKYHT